MRRLERRLGEIVARNQTVARTRVVGKGKEVVEEGGDMVEEGGKVVEEGGKVVE